MKWIWGLIFLLVFIPVLAIAEIGGEASVGYDLKKDIGFTKLELNYVFNLWKIEGFLWAGVNTYMIVEKGLPKYMLRAVYPIGIETTFPPLFIRFEHFCSHPFKYNYESKYNTYEYLWTESGTILSIGVKW